MVPSVHEALLMAWKISWTWKTASEDRITDDADVSVFKHTMTQYSAIPSQVSAYGQHILKGLITSIPTPILLPKPE